MAGAIVESMQLRRAWPLLQTAVTVMDVDPTLGIPMKTFCL